MIRRRHMVGACAQQQLAYGSKLSAALFVGAVVEVRIKGFWCKCSVEDVLSDGSIVRHVKVRRSD